MKQQSQARIEQKPIVRQPEKLNAVLQGIRDDAQALSGTYRSETIVPEGGE